MSREHETGPLSAQPDSGAMAARRSGDAARDERRWGDAVLAYEEYIEFVPNDFGVLVQLGHARKESGDLGGAEEAYSRAETLAPDDADLQLQRGLLCKLVGDVGRARFYFERAASLDPGSAGAHRELNLWEMGEQAVDLTPTSSPGKIDAGREHGRGSGSDEDSSRPAAARKSGDTARDQRRWADAVLFYEAYLEAVPDDFGVLVQLGHARKECGNLDGADAAYDLADGLSPDNADLHLQRGHLYKLKADYGRARFYFARAITLDPNLEEAHRELTNIRVAAGSGVNSVAGSATAPREEAKAAPEPAHTAITLQDLESLPKLHEVADRFETGGDLLKAIQLVRLCLWQEPENGESWRRLSSLLERFGDQDQSKRCDLIALSLGHRPDGQETVARGGNVTEASSLEPSSSTSDLPPESGPRP